MYITLALCFAPLIVEIVFSLIKISSFRLSQAGWAVAAGFAAIVPIIIVQYILQQTDWFSVSSMPSLLAEALIFNGFIFFAGKKNKAAGFYCLCRYCRRHGRFF